MRSLLCTHQYLQETVGIRLFGFRKTTQAISIQGLPHLASWKSYWSHHALGSFHPFIVLTSFWKSTKESGSFFLRKKVISQEAIVEWHDVYFYPRICARSISCEKLWLQWLQDPGRRNMWKTWLTENSTWQGSLIYTYWEDQDAKVAGFIFEGFKTGQVFKGW